MDNLRRCRDAALERLRIQSRRRQNRRSLLHRLPLVLEHRRLLSADPEAVAGGECRDSGRTGGDGVRANPLRVPVADDCAAVADDCARLDLGSVAVRDDVAVPGDLEAGAVRLAVVPGLLLRAIAGAADTKAPKVIEGHEDEGILTGKIVFVSFDLFVPFVAHQRGTPSTCRRSSTASRRCGSAAARFM